jgi:hypothetical protein
MKSDAIGFLVFGTAALIDLVGTYALTYVVAKAVAARWGSAPAIVSALAVCLLGIPLLWIIGDLVVIPWLSFRWLGSRARSRSRVADLRH